MSSSELWKSIPFRLYPRSSPVASIVMLPLEALQSDDMVWVDTITGPSTLCRSKTWVTGQPLSSFTTTVYWPAPKPLNEGEFWGDPPLMVYTTPLVSP